MARSQRSTLLLLLVGSVAGAAAIASYAYFGVYEAEQAETARKEAEEKLFSFEAKALEKLEVFAKGETTTLTRTGEAWSLDAPVSSAADKSVVDGLTARLAGLKSRKVVEGKSELAPFGLDAPSVRIVATEAGGTTHTLLLGAANDFDGSIFAKTGENDRIVTIEGGARYALEKTSFDLREKRLLQIVDDEVRSIAIDRKGTRYTLERDEQQWKLSSPIQDRANDGAVKAILSGLRGVRATGVAAETPTALEAFGLEKPHTRVTLVTAAGTKLELIAGEAQDKLFARAGEGFVAELAKSALDALDKPVEELRDLTVARFDRDAVTQLELEATGADTLRFERTASAEGEESWQLLAPQTGPAKRWKMNSALHAIASLEGKTLVAEEATKLEPYGLAKPTRTLTAKGKDGETLARILLGKEEGGLVYVKSAESPRIYKLEPRKLEALPKTPADILEEPVQAKATSAADEG